MNKHHVRKTLAELMALRRACDKSDENIHQAAGVITKFHQDRINNLRDAVYPGREDDLNEDYLDSVREVDIARRY